MCKIKRRSWAILGLAEISWEKRAFVGPMSSVVVVYTHHSKAITTVHHLLVFSFRRPRLPA